MAGSTGGVELTVGLLRCSLWQEPPVAEQSGWRLSPGEADPMLGDEDGEEIAAGLQLDNSWQGPRFGLAAPPAAGGRLGEGAAVVGSLMGRDVVPRPDGARSMVAWKPAVVSHAGLFWAFFTQYNPTYGYGGLPHLCLPSLSRHPSASPHSQSNAFACLAAWRAGSPGTCRAGSMLPSPTTWTPGTCAAPPCQHWPSRTGCQVGAQAWIAAIGMTWQSAADMALAAQGGC